MNLCPECLHPVSHHRPFLMTRWCASCKTGICKETAK